METYQDEILARVAEVKAKMEAVQAAADAYEAQLTAQEEALQGVLDLNKQYNSKVRVCACSTIGCAPPAPA